MRPELFDKSFYERMKKVCTSIPGHILTFDATLQRAQVQIGIETVMSNGAVIKPPPIADVPVLFLGGTQFTVTHQIDPGDEGMIFFSQRCVDAWKQTGKIGRNPLARFHDTHDAFFVPGFRPLPTRISGHPNDGISIQSRDGGFHVWVKSSGEIVLDNGSGHVKLQADGKVVINGACIINTDGTIEAPNITYDGISAKNHRHTNVESGNSTSGGPTN